MTRPAISVQGLGKSYRLGARTIQRETFREALVQGIRAPFRRFRALGGPPSDRDVFWALRDVSFDVQPGEVIGVIGRNGAGKSTLLKVLSRITEPTTGEVRLRGRVASLLEVGTGFHSELTGRENIYLNGSILGMRRAEITRKFDAIVDFAGVEAFLDTPVKRYSSGMYVRLAFAVAAHLEPEILLVDEVLAVGDANFQRKCIDHMTHLAHSGKTILFVSHNMDLIPRLCNRAILMKEGRVQDSGPADAVTLRYLESFLEEDADGDLSEKPRVGNGRARFAWIHALDDRGRPLAVHSSGDELRFRFGIEAREDIPNVSLALNLHALQGAKIVSSLSDEIGFPVRLHKGSQSFECRFRGPQLRPGHKICVYLWMATEDVIDAVENACVLDIVDGADSARVSNRGDQGIVLSDYEFRQLAPCASGA